MLGKINQNIERPAAKGERYTIASKGPLANRKFERAEPQFPMNRGVRHVSAKMKNFLGPICVPSAGRRCNCARVKLATTKLVVVPTPLERTN